MSKHKRRRIACFACAFIMLFAALAPPVYAETAAEKYKRLKEELTTITQQINSYKSSKAQAEKLRKALLEQKATLDQMIALNQQQIAEAEASLAAKQEEVAQKRAVIYENDQLFRQRLVAIYKQNNSGILSSILNVNNFSEFLTVTDSLRRISVNDTDLLTLLNQQQTELEAEQAEIDTLLASLQSSYDELAANAEVLAQNIADQNAKISAADAQIKAQEEAYDDTYADLVAAQKEMSQIGGSLGGSSSGDGSQYVGGQFTWPVPGFYGITCYFGAADPNGKGHRGMDISGSGVNGATIVAAGKGRVIQATYAHSSYGNYIVVDHGAGTKTLYAHCSSLTASVGTEVEAGTPIATVGNTGFVVGASGGYHLHFEVLQDGVPQNPLNYLK